MTDTSPRVVVTGRACGGFRMRGAAPAGLLGWKVVKPDQACGEGAGVDAVVLVKYDDGTGSLIRRHCRVMVYDPLDAWMKANQKDDPGDFFFRRWQSMRFDAILAASPSSAEVMRAVLPETVKVVLAPHHPDPLCVPDWYNPYGPVVYAGGPKYLGEAATSRIASACRQLGRVFRLDDRKDAYGLKGAAACIALREYPHDTPLNRLCKPQVKLANALACGIPALASLHRCSTSLYDWPLYVDEFPVNSQVKAVRLIERLLARPRPEGSTPLLGDHARLLKDTVNDLLRDR